MNIIQKSIDGLTPHILRLKKLLAGVLASCWSMMLHLLFFLERVFWQIKRSQLIALIGQGYTMLVGGAPKSAHREGIAFDISLRGHDRNELLRQCREAGFGSFGKYKTFLHVDTRRNRKWGSWD
jgi:hypothetical protein